MSHLHIAEAVPLGYALVARVASDAGVRALCIKGPITSELRLRPSSHVSQDVDVLVSPTQVEVLVQALVANGWRLVPASTPHPLDVPHSIQLNNTSLGVEVDLHHRYPGFTRPPADVFDLLWGRRRRWNAAETPVWATDIASTYLIELLHLARDPQRRHARLRAHLAGQGIDRDAVWTLALATGADFAVAEHMGRKAESGDEDPAWRRRTELGSVPGAALLYQLETAPRGSRLHAWWRAVWPSAATIVKNYPNDSATPSERLVIRAARLQRAARRLPRARREVKRFRQGE